MRSSWTDPASENGYSASAPSDDSIAEIDELGEDFDIAFRAARTSRQPVPRIEVYLFSVSETNRPMLRKHLERLLEELEVSCPEPKGRVGQRLGDYQLLEEIGEGGQGCVFQARSIHAPQEVALKIIKPSHRERVRRELDVACRLDHDHLVRIHHIGEDDGELFFTMPLAEKGTLEDHLGDYSLAPPLGDAFPPEAVRQRKQRLATFLAKVARAIHYLHTEPQVLHRDLKPKNILLDARGEPLVIDLSQAATVGYMSPEQAKGKTQLTAASDIYSLGVILFRLLTNKLPFQGSEKEIIEQTADPDRPAPSPQTRDAAKSDLERICEKCLVKRPEGRYSTALNLAEDLEQFARDEETSVRPRSWAERTMQGIVAGINHKLSLDGIARWSAIDFWDAGLNLALSCALYALISADRPIAELWLAQLTFIVVWWWAFLTHFFRKKQPTATERSLALLWAGVTLAGVTLFWLHCPPVRPSKAADALAYYPPWAVVNGLAFLVVGRIYWGRYYLVGLAHFVVALLMPLCLGLAPIVYGVFVAICMGVAGWDHHRAAQRGKLIQSD